MVFEIKTTGGGIYLVSDEAVKESVEKEKEKKSIPDLFLGLPVINSEQKKPKRKNQWLDGLKSRLARG